jgi:hypothetical protein
MQENEKNLFHGSKMVVEQPLREKCRENNDFGKCFYCTESLDLAKEWACQKGSVGIVSAYTLDMTGLSVVYLNSDEYHLLHWITMLLQYRRPNNLSNRREGIKNDDPRLFRSIYRGRTGKFR